MPRLAAIKVSEVTQPNGDIIQKTVSRNKAGLLLIKRKKIACGIPSANKVPVVIRVIKTRYGNRAPNEPVPSAQTLSSRKKNAKHARTAMAKKPRLTAAPETVTEKVYHARTDFIGGKYDSNWDTLKPVYLQTTNKIPAILRKCKARTGVHIDKFQEDFATRTSSLKSLNLEGTRGGRSLPLPIAQIQAQERLTEFYKLFPNSYLICQFLLVEGIPLERITVPKGWRRIEDAVQDAVDDLARFYSPEKTQPDRGLVALGRMLVDDIQRFEGGATSGFNKYPVKPKKG